MAVLFDVFTEGVSVTFYVVDQSAIWNVIKQHLLFLENSFDPVLVVVDLLWICDCAVKRTYTYNDQKHCAKAVWMKNDSQVLVLFDKHT